MHFHIDNNECGCQLHRLSNKDHISSPVRDPWLRYRVTLNNALYYHTIWQILDYWVAIRVGVKVTDTVSDGN